MLARKLQEIGSLTSKLAPGQGGLSGPDRNELATISQMLSSLPLPDATADAAKLREDRRKEKAARKAAEMDKAMAGLKQLEEEGVQDDAEVRGLNSMSGRRPAFGVIEQRKTRFQKMAKA